MRRLIVWFLFCALCLGVMAQTSNNPLWFDGDPDNDPDEQNYCFIYWDCVTGADWELGYQAWRSAGNIPGKTPPPTRQPATFGDFNLCHSAWICQGEAEWRRGWHRGYDIFNPQPATASATATPVVQQIIVTVVVKWPVTVTPTPPPTPTPTEASQKVQPPGEPEDPVGVGENTESGCPEGQVLVEGVGGATCQNPLPSLG